MLLGGVGVTQLPCVEWGTEVSQSQRQPCLLTGDSCPAPPCPVEGEACASQPWALRVGGRADSP